MYRKIIIGLVCVFIFILSACSEDRGSPEDQIRSMIAAMESAVEQRSLDSVKELVATDYKDEWNGNRRAALRSLMVYFTGHQNIHLLTRVSDVQLGDDGKSAHATVYVGMAGKRIENADYLISLNADLYRFDIDLVADGSEWMLSYARWQKVRPEDFDF